MLQGSDYSGISKVFLPRCTRTIDRACLNKDKTFAKKVIGLGWDYLP